MNKYIYISEHDPDAHNHQGETVEFYDDYEWIVIEKADYIVKPEWSFSFKIKRQEGYMGKIDFKGMRIKNPDHEGEFQVGQLLIDPRSSLRTNVLGINEKGDIWRTYMRPPTLEEARKMLPQFNIEEE